MIKFIKEDKLQTTIDALLDEMKDHAGDSESYSKMTDQLHTLLEAQAAKTVSKSKVKETALLAGANLAGIITIVHFEKLGVITSKALTLLVKTKI